MALAMTPNSSAAVVAAWSVLLVSTVALIVRQVLLPRPLPGIPYNAPAARQISGDVSELQASAGVRAFMRAQFLRHNSAVVQVFLSPLGKPRVLISDFREAHDITAGRSREFDKSRLTSDSFRGIVPQSFVSFKAEHPVFKTNKELIKDLMTPAFFRHASAPEIYRNILVLVELWRLKLRLGGGRPFSADHDLHKVTMDIFLAVTFDRHSTDTMARRDIDHLQRHYQHGGSPGDGQVAVFPHLPMPADVEACVYLTESINVGFQSPLPRIAHWLYLQTPTSRRHTRLKRGLIRRKVEEAVARLGSRQDEDRQLIAGVDNILLREKDLAEKRGSTPDFYSEAIHDELFTFIAGGHDNSASLFTWWVKFMASHPESQSRLRRELQAAHAVAVGREKDASPTRRLPTVDEILDTRVPFLDAIIEETIRCSHIVPVTAREALVDTNILGHHIPKGTHVYLLSNGPSFLLPALAVDESLRTDAARAARDIHGVWDPANVADFVPERWLRPDGAFDPLAGPQMAFGGGPRGCFGRKMVYLELRIVVTILTLAFEFCDLDDALNTFNTRESSTEAPQDCYVKLRPVVDWDFDF